MANLRRVYYESRGSGSFSCCHGNVKNTNMAVNLESKTLLGNWVEEVKSFTTLLNQFNRILAPMC